MKLKWDLSEWLEFADRLGNVEEFNKHVKLATQKIAKKLHDMLIQNTPVDFGTLQAFWRTDENYSYMVTQTKTGFEVTLINRAIYALWVNDGHKQRPGRFIPGYWEGKHFRYDPNADEGMRLKDSWVEGKFFVESSIAMVENSNSLNKILENELNQWFRWCVNGK